MVEHYKDRPFLIHVADPAPQMEDYYRELIDAERFQNKGKDEDEPDLVDSSSSEGEKNNQTTTATEAEHDGTSSESETDDSWWNNEELLKTLVTRVTTKVTANVGTQLHPWKIFPAAAKPGPMHPKHIGCRYCSNYYSHE